MPADNVYTVGREDAAHELGVSTRTLDRWLRSGKLKHRVVNRSVYIHAGDVAKMLRQLGNNPRRETMYEAPPRSNEQPAAGFSQHIDDVHTSETITTPDSRKEQIFKKLYEEVAADVKQKQEKLEAAHFRVGQLETQLKNSVPLLEHKQAQDEARQKLEEIERDNIRLTATLSAEKLKFWAITGVAGVLILVAIVLTFVVLR